MSQHNKYFNLTGGFNISAENMPVDIRTVLTKAEMLTVGNGSFEAHTGQLEDGTIISLPDKYFILCSTNNVFYTFNFTNEYIGSTSVGDRPFELGKFRIASKEEFQALQSAIQTEKQSRLAADEQISSALSEATSSLSNSITALNSDIRTDLDTLNSDIQNELDILSTSIGTNSANINIEIASRTAAISEEQAAREQLNLIIGHTTVLDDNGQVDRNWEPSYSPILTRINTAEASLTTINNLLGITSESAQSQTSLIDIIGISTSEFDKDQDLSIWARLNNVDTRLTNIDTITGFDSNVAATTTELSKLTRNTWYIEANEHYTTGITGTLDDETDPSRLPNSDNINKNDLLYYKNIYSKYLIYMWNGVSWEQVATSTGGGGGTTNIITKITTTSSVILDEAGEAAATNYFYADEVDTITITPDIIVGASVTEVKYKYGSGNWSGDIKENMSFSTSKGDTEPYTIKVTAFYEGNSQTKTQIISPKRWVYYDTSTNSSLTDINSSSDKILQAGSTGTHTYNIPEGTNQYVYFQTPFIEDDGTLKFYLGSLLEGGMSKVELDNDNNSYLLFKSNQAQNAGSLTLKISKE